MKWIKAFLIAAVIVLSSLPYNPVHANVTGPCGNCHTMHNSQNSLPVARDGTGAGWDGAGKISGGSLQADPLPHLLVSGCVGCHTSTTGETIISIGGSRIPIVFNTGGYPAKPLAGGNFYYTSLGEAANNAKGHNVYGIAGQDSQLNTAPGGNPAGCGNNTCHNTLAALSSSDNYDRGGCQGCHVFTYHHEDNSVYRFLKGHGENPLIATLTKARKDIVAYPDYVIGVEDPDWEQETVSNHNYYKGTNVITYVSGGNSLTTYQTITAFCSGCHSKFHGPIRDSEGMGSSSPWLRHPTDIALPETGEYSDYTTYSIEAPVAYINPSSPTRATAVVMCLSCHRVHGSPYDDILRWDYGTMLAGGTNTGGCFTCHTLKRHSP